MTDHSEADARGTRAAEPRGSRRPLRAAAEWRSPERPPRTPPGSPPGPSRAPEPAPPPPAVPIVLRPSPREAELQDEIKHLRQELRLLREEVVGLRNALARLSGPVTL